MGVMRTVLWHGSTRAGACGVSLLAEEDSLDEEWLALPLSEVEQLLALAVGSLSIRCCAMAFLVLVVTRFVCLR